MTQPPPRQVPCTHESDSSQLRDMSHDPTNCLRPAADTASDNDTSEKPVREKLKKTSIASISQHATKTQEAGIHVGSSPTGNTGVDLIRGRPIKKRSYDDLELLETDTNIIGASGSRDVKHNGHARKRSRDVRAGEPLKGERQPRAVESTVEEEAEDASNRVETAGVNVAYPPSFPPQMGIEQYATSNDRPETSHHDIGIVVDEASSEARKDFTDQEMRDSASSPRKKRSRDQFDSDADREQKIPATEEARAQRRSDELERAEVARANSDGVVLPEVPVPSDQEPNFVRESTESMAIEVEASRKPDSGTFGSTSVLSAPNAYVRSISPSKSPANPQSQKSSAGFATSGFAALSSSATSPFGSLGASSTTATAPGSFAAPALINPKNVESFTEMETNNTEPAVNGGFGAFAKKSSSTFAVTEPSPFGASGVAKGSVFGGSIFGGGFGGGFSGGGKLTNFAAPKGDAKVGTINGAVKPIGSPTHEADNEENSEDEGDGLGENDEDGDDEVDGRFQHKDVETGEDEEICLFSSRASLYTFKEKNWREAGKGVFKFNINAKSTDDPDPDLDADQKKGRFIMRAQQTFRVLLNAPVLKGMKMNEPTGKSVSFGVLEDSKVVIYMVKLADSTESKKLYHEVRKLQENMSET